MKFKALQIILTVGILLRLALWWVNPSGNAYDNFLQPIFLYAENPARPAPFDCWECYQPPVYYALASALYQLAKAIFNEPQFIWKLVQLLNPILSIGVLTFFYFYLKKIKANERFSLMIFSFVAFLPRELFTSAAISNDYLLVFTSLFSSYYFLRFTDKMMLGGGKAQKEFLLMGLFVVLGSLTKQHGMLLLGLPLYAILHLLIVKNYSYLKFVVPVSILVFGLSLSEEAYKYSETGHFLVSNQHHFVPDKKQFPGSLAGVEFFTLRLVSLLNEPYLTESTSASLPSSIFARSFFDYEWRFLHPGLKWTHYLAAIGYFIGIFWLLFFLYLSYRALKKAGSFRATLQVSKLRYLALSLLAICYMLVPVIQTIRFPSFSSMKAMFLLPGIFIMLLVYSKTLNKLPILKNLVYPAVTISLGYSLIMVITIMLILPHSLDKLFGPIWPLPR